MFARVLKSNQPIVFVITLLMGIGLWVFTFIKPIPMSIPSDNMQMPFYRILEGLFNKNSSYLNVFTFIIILIQSILLVQFNKKYILINYRTYLPAFFYILIASSFIQLQRLNPVIIGALFVYFAIDYLFGTYRSEYALNKLYLAGFFISIASLFWAPFATLFILIWISLTVLRPFIGREWLVSLLGFITPYFFIIVYYFVFSENYLHTFFDIFLSNFVLIKHFYHLHFSYYIFYSLLSILIIIASFNIVRNLQKKKIKTRKFYLINWWLFMMGLLLFVLFKNIKYEIVYLLAIPVSYLLTDYFYSIKRNWTINVITILLIGSIVYIQIIAHY